MSQHLHTYEDQIRTLTNEYLTGIISHEDQTFLQRIIHEDVIAKQICLHTIEQYKKLHQKGLKDLRLPAEIMEEIEAERPHRSRKIGWMAAAASVVLVLCTYYLTREKTVKPEGITLTLADGKMISLAKKTANIKTGDVVLNNVSGTLSYKAAAATKGNNTLTVPAGLNYQLELADGSKIWLNSATTLTFPFQFANGHREVTLNGEAYMEIATNPAHPFLVHLPGGKTVTVLGTTLNVNTYDSSQARVALVSGKVKVSVNGQSTQLDPGYQAIATEKEIMRTPFQPETILSWRQGEYYFEKTSLKEIRPVLSRWYGIPVMIDSRETEQILFTGTIYRKNNIETFLQSLHILMGVSYYYQDATLHIK